ncbi:hypothetical protein D8674_031408 [Pyrus ussuriensis x Pyrus communis]|uniref:Uncharacterized protein n=1 Tax=Pyrus ussuriensis x Pyrus communis TaxID=2448454 RepID=A0A5N5EYG6_9ROSA|nr:hypothetical protein D8674_031408 [Pyrus ussuriensis x Pyrus communis]
MKQGQGSSSRNNFCCRRVREPCRSFGRRCSMLVKEQRARFYILRRCVTMLLCWHERGDP